VELNSTFYQNPDPKTFRTWAARAPADFLFAVKAPRDLTHRRGQNPDLLLQDLYSAALGLGEHLGPILAAVARDAVDGALAWPRESRC
jgi:uncharacterized protein YecE (DUF72 family)